MNNVWVEDTKQGDWRLYTDTHTAITWQRIDGWQVSIGFDETQEIILNQPKIKSLEEAKKFAEDYLIGIGVNLTKELSTKTVNLHRIQIDIDIEAESHQAAVEKVMHWFCPQNTLHCHDSLVLEENEEICPTCTPGLMKDGGYTIYQEYNLNRNQASAKEQNNE